MVPWNQTCVDMCKDLKVEEEDKIKNEVRNGACIIQTPAEMWFLDFELCISPPIHLLTPFLQQDKTWMQ